MLHSVARGGSISADDALKRSLDDYVRKSRLETQSFINFCVVPGANGVQPQHEVRDLIRNYLFSSAPSARAASISLAKRLGKAMDDRSPFTLMLLTAYESGDTRRLIIWAFPKDEPFQFTANGKGARIKIVQDAFSRSSSFKKAALFEGSDGTNEFMMGRVIDKQSEHGFKTAADYWVSDFLGSQYSLTGTAGTLLLANRLKTSYESAVTQADRDQLSSAVVAIHASQRQQWSIRRVANEFLTGTLKQTFIEGTPKEAISATFRLHKDVLGQKLCFRVFRLKDDVIVSAPFGTIGKSVQIHNGATRTLSYSGTVVDEKVRAKRG